MSISKPIGGESTERDLVVALANSMEGLTREVGNLRDDLHDYRQQMDGDNKQDGWKTRLTMVEREAKDTADSVRWITRLFAAQVVILAFCGIGGLITWLVTHSVK